MGAQMLTEEDVLTSILREPKSDTHVVVLMLRISWYGINQIKLTLDDCNWKHWMEAQKQLQNLVRMEKIISEAIKCQIPEEDGRDGKEDPLNPFQLGLLLLPLENAKIMVNMPDKGKEGFQKEVSRVINEIGRQKNMKSLSDLSFWPV